MSDQHDIPPLSDDGTPAAPLPPLAAAPRRRLSPWPVVAVVAIGLAGWQWLETRQLLQGTEATVAQRLADHEQADQEGRLSAKESQARVEALQDKVAVLEGKLTEFQSQAATLQGFYQDLARGRDEALLLEVEQGLNLALQQLQIAGNVPAALLALQTADAKLARQDRPQWMPLRQALGKDIDRLRGLPAVDVPGTSLKLENLVAAMDKLPLADAKRPQPVAQEMLAAGAESAWWQRLGGALWQEVKGLVRIQRFDGNAPVLLAPEQAFFLRENCKLHLLNARLALYARDQGTFRQDLKTARESLGRYFDGADPAVVAARATLGQLAEQEISLQAPGLNDSLFALRALRTGKEKK